MLLFIVIVFVFTVIFVVVCTVSVIVVFVFAFVVVFVVGFVVVFCYFCFTFVVFSLFVLFIVFNFDLIRANINCLLRVVNKLQIEVRKALHWKALNIYIIGNH